MILTPFSFTCTLWVFPDSWGKMPANIVQQAGRDFILVENTILGLLMYWLA